MNVLMISDFYPPFRGGVEVLVSRLAQQLTLRGHSVTVATLNAAQLPAVSHEDGVEVHRLRSTTQRSARLFANPSRPWAPPAPDPEVVIALRRLLASHQFDVVHGHDWLARSYLPLASRRSAALVMSLHYFTLTCPKKTLIFDGRPCTGPAVRKCLRCAGAHYGHPKGLSVTAGNRVFASQELEKVDLFLPVSRSTARENGLQDGQHEYMVVPNLLVEAPPSDAERDLLSGLPSEEFLLFVGDMRHEKGIHVLLDAYRRLSDPPPLLLIAKNWDARFAPLPPGVVVERSWPNAAVQAAMSRCIALVVPSVWAEPFGIVVTEALAAGCPVVASRVGGIPEIVDDGREGLLVEPGDVKGLTAALRRVCDDLELRHGLAVRAKIRSKAYEAAVVIPQFEAAYVHARDLRERRRREVHR